MSAGSERKTGLKVLFLSSDTGGGHRASAESLAKQFELLYPGSTYDLLDVMSKDGVPPYNGLVESYKHLSAHPNHWKVVYSISNLRAFEFFFDVHQKLMCEKAIRKSIMDYSPDVVVSVHPLMTNVPIASCAKISEETGRHLPIFTVVTDLGSAHCLWFANGVDKMFVASDQIRALAKSRGKVPDEKLVQIGLPIRHAFAEQAEGLGDRMSQEGRAYQRVIRQCLQLPFHDRKTVLVMGGGEGVGSLSNIVDSLYVDFRNKGIDSLILVVCGRNEKLKAELEGRNWDNFYRQYMETNKSSSLFSFASCGSSSTAGGASQRLTGVFQTYSGYSFGPWNSAPHNDNAQGCIENSMADKIRRILSTSSFNALQDISSDLIIEKASGMATEEPFECIEGVQSPLKQPNSEADLNISEEPLLSSAPESSDIQINDAIGNVSVVALGFVTNIAEYMVAADVLVSKAGPGTIAEATSLSLPIMLTSFLPGQEEGNVDFVVEGGFGSFISDSDPLGIAETIAGWLLDDEKLANMSKAAKAKGAPYAARDIVRVIGDVSLKWKQINDSRDRLDRQAAALMNGVSLSGESS
jgi:UDP-N-acetylglucosamine:LPS N-acetylglucosamine transferase